MNNTNTEQTLRSINITFIAPFENHISNGGEKLLGNSSSIKKTNSGHVYDSGQKVRYAFCQSLEQLVNNEINNDGLFVSTGDAIPTDIAHNLRADFCGYMHPKGDAYMGKRVSPVSVTYAVSKKPSEIHTDLLTRYSNMDKTDNTIAHKEVSEYDEMVFNFRLNVDSLGVRTFDKIEDNLNYGKVCVGFYSLEEKLRRIKWFIKAATSLNSFSNNSRNMVSAEPTEIIISFSSNHSAKINRYFSPNTTDMQRQTIIKDLKKTNNDLFFGDDNTENSASDCVDAALAAINNWTIPHPLNVKTETEFKAMVEEQCENIKVSPPKPTKDKKDKKGKSEESESLVEYND